MIVIYKFNNDEKTYRAGVIPYTILKGKIYFLFGIDSRSKDLTDFGGKIEDDETALQGAFREFFEESYGIFDSDLYDSEAQSKMPTILSDHKTITVVFLPVPKKWLSCAKKEFLKKKKLYRYHEMTDIKWVGEYMFQKKMIKDDHTIWSTMRDFLTLFCKADEFYETLKDKFKF